MLFVFFCKSIYADEHIRNGILLQMIDNSPSVPNDLTDVTYKSHKKHKNEELDAESSLRVCLLEF